MSCRNSLSRFFLIVINVILLLVGLALLGVGIWIVVSPSSFTKEALRLTNAAYASDYNAQMLAQLLLSNTSLLMVGSYMILAVGGFVALVSVCGCAGAKWKNKCLLGLYAAITALCFLVLLAAGIVVALFQNQAANYVTMGFQTLQNTEFDGLANSSNAFSVMWYTLMQNFACCGLNGSSDFSLVNAPNLASKWSSMNRMTCSTTQCFASTANATVLIPASCCVAYANGTLLSSTCPYTTMYSNVQGCQNNMLQQLYSTLQKYAYIVMAVTFGLDGGCLLAIIAASILMHDIGKSDHYA